MGNNYNHYSGTINYASKFRRANWLVQVKNVSWNKNHRLRFDQYRRDNEKIRASIRRLYGLGRKRWKSNQSLQTLHMRLGSRNHGTPCSLSSRYCKDSPVSNGNKQDNIDPHGLDPLSRGGHIPFLERCECHSIGMYSSTRQSIRTLWKVKAETKIQKWKIQYLFDNAHWCSEHVRTRFLLGTSWRNKAAYAIVQESRSAIMHLRYDPQRRHERSVSILPINSNDECAVHERRRMRKWKSENTF